MKYVCELCGMIYDEERGDEKRGIPAGTAFEALPADYECPGCGSALEAFDKAVKRANTHASRDDGKLWREMKYIEPDTESQR